MAFPRTEWIVCRTKGYGTATPLARSRLASCTLHDEATGRTSLADWLRCSCTVGISPSLEIEDILPSVRHAGRIRGSTFSLTFRKRRVIQKSNFCAVSEQSAGSIGENYFALDVVQDRIPQDIDNAIQTSTEAC